MKTDARFAHAWDEIRAGNLDEAERIFEEATLAEPLVADSWNGLGAVRFERGDLEASQKCYEKALAAAKTACGGTLPKRLYWNDDGKPTLRAIHGLGLNYFRSGKFAEAREKFDLLLKLNPDDNQGAGMILRDIARKADLWKKDNSDGSPA